MVENLSNYAMTIMCSSVLINLIQMLLPKNENKKYVLFVSNVILMIIIITPVISMLNSNINVREVLEQNEKEYIKIDEEEYETNYNNELISKYKKNIESSIIERLEKSGYEVNIISCEYDKETLEPKYIKLNLRDSNGNVQPVKVEVFLNNEKDEDEINPLRKLEIENMLKATYGFKIVEIN